MIFLISMGLGLMMGLLLRLKKGEKLEYLKWSWDMVDCVFRKSDPPLQK